LVEYRQCITIYRNASDVKERLLDDVQPPRLVVPDFARRTYGAWDAPHETRL
jgi:hypothetical protein